MYLYLARRDRTSIKLLMVLRGEARSGRVDNLNSLGLPPEIFEAIEQEVHVNRMLWEPMIEPADSYHQLKGKLHNRGFSELPMSANPVVSQIRGQSAQTTKVASGRRSMIQRKS